MQYKLAKSEFCDIFPVFLLLKKYGVSCGKVSTINPSNILDGFFYLQKNCFSIYFAVRKSGENSFLFLHIV